MRRILVGNVPIGDGAPISVQSMTNTPTADYDATLRQVLALAEAGCDIVRVTVNDRAVLPAFARLCAASPVPIVADIHYDYRLALAAIDAGAAKIRLNPGNLAEESQVAEVARAATARHIPIRIGVNGGSLPKDVEGESVAERMVYSALRQADQLARYGMADVCLSVKCSDVRETYNAYKMLRERCDYPLHIGLTESGGGSMAESKSYACIGGLLLEGIGDTLRVSLSDDPVREVEAGLMLLRAIGLRKDWVNVISCPTCGRTTFDVIGVADAIRRATAHIRKPLTVAVMGCVVNGLGEGAAADIGVAGGKAQSVIFAHGHKVCTVDNDAVLPTLLRYIEEATHG